MDLVRMRFLAPGWLLLCLLFGGSTTGGVLANGALQIVAGAILIWLANANGRFGVNQPTRHFLLLSLGAGALGLLALVPLPPALWQRLAGRSEIADAYSLIGMPLPWLPLSLTPDATIVALLSLLPPLAMFFLVLQSSEEGRRTVVLTLAVFAFASVLFGVVQQVAGYSSDTYIYQYTSRGGAVGFFANRNHLATLCLMTMPFLAALATLARRPRERAQPGAWIPTIAMLALMVVGALVVQSLAGWLLLPPTLFACFLLLRRQRNRGGRSRTLIAVGAVLLLGAILAALFAPWSSTDLFPVTAEVNPQQRRTIMALTWQAARDFFPFGAGPGSFVSIYPRFEDPTIAFTAYINHAHNDYLEMLLEWGAVGVLLIAGFVLWWGGRIRSVWRAGGDPIARAATISIGVALAHSFVDYPVRTAAIFSVMALCCGLAAAPAPNSAKEQAPTPPPSAASARTIMLGRKDGPSRPTPPASAA